MKIASVEYGSRVFQVFHQPGEVLTVIILLSLFCNLWSQEIKVTVDRTTINKEWDSIARQVRSNTYSPSVKDSVYRFYKIDPSVVALRRAIDYQFPVSSKEICLYDGGWQFVRAGFAILATSLDSATQSYLIYGKAYSNAFMSVFYEIEDHVAGIIDQQGLYPRYFEHHIRENRYSKNGWYVYDHTKRKLYTSGRKEGTEFTITPFTQNYISLLYCLRARPLMVGDTFSINCFVHGKDYPIFFRVVQKEVITVKAGTFSCVKVIPRLVGQGYGFTSSDKMSLWFSDDADHLLVQAASKVRLGSISAHLLKVIRE
ncbi:MAG: DUF3108 domain-containing protein [Chitinivibrionales bacterium]|nr:DUF3108 domain-containing protein [Chitinivibrionales bacterium]